MYAPSPRTLSREADAIVYNGYCQALSCPPMNRLHEVPRGAAIEELVKRFPQESSQEVKKRLKGESVLKQMIEQARIRDPLLLIITVGKSLPPLSLKEIKDACILVSVGDQEQRTKVIKRASHPEWNETLVLYVYAPVEDAPYSHSNVLGIDAALATLTVTYRSRDKIMCALTCLPVCATHAATVRSARSALETYAQRSSRTSGLNSLSPTLCTRLPLLQQHIARARSALSRSASTWQGRVLFYALCAAFISAAVLLCSTRTDSTMSAA